MTTLIVWTAVFAGTTLVVFLAVGRGGHADIGVLAASMLLAMIAFCVLRIVAPTTPLWVGLVGALAGWPVILAGVYGWALLWPQPRIQPKPPVGTCGRCAADLWDRAGNHRHTDHDSSYLCPPEQWQPGQHRLHHLARARPAATKDTVGGNRDG